MRELITKISDYMNEKSNEPQRREDRLAIAVIGVSAAVVVVLLLLLLWGYLAGARRHRDKETAGAGEELTATTYEEKTAEYMAQNGAQEEEAFRQEYLDSIAGLSDKVEGLLAAMEQAEQDLTKTVEELHEEDGTARERLLALRGEVTTIIHNLRQTEMKLHDLSDLVGIMERETIPIIREQLVEIRGEMEQVHTDMSNLYAKIATLEQEDIKLKNEDDKLWAGIGALEKTLHTVLNRNMSEVNQQFDTLVSRFDSLLNQFKTVENRLGNLSGHTLQYRYDAGKDTLYLEPYDESGE